MFQNTPSARPAARAEDGFLRLGMGADDQRRLDFLQPPAGGDAGGLAGRVLAIRSGADHLGIGAAFDTAEHGIVAAVEKFLHLAGQGGEVFRRGEQVAMGGEDVVGPGVAGAHQHRIAFGAGGARGGLCHLAGAAGAGMIDDQELGHGRLS